MYSYITKELVNIIDVNFPTINTKVMGITGHSMGILSFSSSCINIINCINKGDTGL